MCNNTTGLENQTGPEMNPQCFLRSSPENRVSPRASPNHISNGPFNKVSVLSYYLRGFSSIYPIQMVLNSASIFSISLLFFQSSSPQPAFILQSTSLITQPPKTREPPRYEEAVKQSRNLHANHVSQVSYTLSTTQTMPYISPAAPAESFRQSIFLVFQP